MACPAVAIEREVIRCAACLLNQFMPANECCRRCHIALRPQKVVAAVIEMPKPLLPPSTANYSVRMAEAVRFWRRQVLNISQREFAQRMDVPRSYVSKLENEKATPIISLLPRLASALDLSVYELMLFASL